MYGCNKLYCEQLGRYYARHYKQLAAEHAEREGGLPVRAVPGPDLGGRRCRRAARRTIAPEMIHAAAKGEPYACFVRPDTRIPFMAMPDGVEALLQLAAAPRDRLTRTAYNVGAFNPSAEEIRDVVLRAFPGAEITSASTPSGRASSTRGRRTWTTARRGATGASRRVRLRARVLRVPDPDDPAALPALNQRSVAG